MGEFDIAITGTRVIELTIAQELSAAYKNIIVLEKKYPLVGRQVIVIAK